VASTVIAVVVAVCPGGSARAGGDAARGKAVFVRQCALCHTADRDGGNRFGPALFGIVGRKAGSAPGFAYSAAFRTRVDWDWSEEAIGGFVTSPSTMVPGTAMGVFQGVAARDRDDLVAYLLTLR